MGIQPAVFLVKGPLEGSQIRVGQGTVARNLDGQLEALARIAEVGAAS